MSRIRMTIDRLVVQGLEQGREKPLIDSLQAQLSEMLSDRRTRTEWTHSHRTLVLRLGKVAMEPGSAGAKKFGSSVARGIGRGLKA